MSQLARASYVGADLEAEGAEYPPECVGPEIRVDTRSGSTPT